MTWKQMKQAAEDLQKQLGIKPPLTTAIKCNDSRLREWIEDASELIDPGDVLLQANTIEVLRDEFGFEMPTAEVEEEEEEEVDYVPDPYADDHTAEDERYTIEYLAEAQDPSIEDIDTIEKEITAETPHKPRRLRPKPHTLPSARTKRTRPPVE